MFLTILIVVIYFKKKTQNVPKISKTTYIQMYVHILNDCHIPSMWYPNLSKIVLSPCPVCIHVRVHASYFKLK